MPHVVREVRDLHATHSEGRGAELS